MLTVLCYWKNSNNITTLILKVTIELLIFFSMLHFLLVIFLWTLVSKFERTSISSVLNRVPIFSLLPRKTAFMKSIIMDWKHSKYNGKISGTVVESVSQEKAVETYLQLQKRRDKWINNFIIENCGIPSKHDYCSFPLHLTEILDTSKSTNLKSGYRKLFSLNKEKHFTNISVINSTITECYHSKDGVVIRKFEGNREAKMIYTPAHRCNY